MNKKMKNVKVIRKLDKLGRFTIPIVARNEQEIIEGTLMEVFIDGNKMVYKKHKKSCSFCSNTDNLMNFKEKPICSNCIKNLKKI